MAAPPYKIHLDSIIRLNCISIIGGAAIALTVDWYDKYTLNSDIIVLFQICAFALLLLSILVASALKHFINGAYIHKGVIFSASGTLLGSGFMLINGLRILLIILARRSALTQLGLATFFVFALAALFGSLANAVYSTAPIKDSYEKKDKGA